MKNFKLSLRTEIILNMTILMLAMIILLSILIGSVSKNDIYLKKAEGSLELIQALSNIILPIINQNNDAKNEDVKKKEIKEIVDAFFKNVKDPKSNIIITNKDGKIYYNSNGNSKEEKVKDEKFLELVKLKTPLTTFEDVKDEAAQDEQKKLLIYFPLWGEKDMTGGIIAQFSLSKERRSVARSQSIVLLLIILDAFLFIIFGSFLLSRVIVKPITKLVHATEKIADGNLNFKVESFPATEIDSLSESFNKMTKKLSQSKESLQESVESLKKVNLELKQARDEVIRSEKLASVGRLAAGVAHEIGNPLGSILGYLEILNEDKDADVDGYLKRIHKESLRIDTIVRELLDYSREHKFAIEDVDLNEVIKETCDTLFHRKMFANISRKMNLSANLPAIKADKGQIQQVITNLIINSADAMEKGEGEITLTTKTAEYKKEMFSSQHFKEKDMLVWFSIKDTGCGIAEKDLGSIFDPFYTTKEPGKGTGLGLAISLRIIESFKGAITVESKKNHGTTFNIYLPIPSRVL